MANINATKFLPGSTATEPEKKTRAKPTIIPKRDLIVIRNRVIKIRDLVKNTTLLSEKETERKRIETEEEKFDAKEKKLEEKPDEKGEDKKSKIPGLPKLGFIDRIKSFFFKVLLGYVTVRLLPHINKLPDIVGKIGSAIDFGTDLALGLFNGLASFIDWGYKAYDATRGFLKTFGGDNVVKLFDGFGDAVNKVIDATIIAALALTSLGGDDGFGPGAGKRGFDKSGRRVGKNLQERYARRFGRGQFLERFGRRNLRNLSGGMRGGVRGTAKSVLGFVRPLLKRIPLPVVGALIDFGLSVALGEPLGKAAFKSIGAGLAGFVGAAIGSIPVLIPFGGPLIGGILGGMAGDALGSALYDMFFGGKKPKPQKTTKAATGGQVTRGGKPVGGPAKRTIKRTVKIQPTKIKPGASVGGEEKIKKIFPEVKPGDKGKKVNTLGYMKSSYDKSSSIPGFGGLFAIQSKVQLGQKPSDLDYQNAAAGLNAWMQRTFSSEIMRTSGAFAEGGSVDVGMFGSGEDMTNMIAKSLENNISPRMNDIFNDLMKQMMLKEVKGDPSPGKGPDGSDPDDPAGVGGDLSGDDRNKFMQVALAAIKAGDTLNGYVTATQFALESGWGKYPSGKNNYFGQKGKPGTARRTREVYGGKDSYIVDTFKDYPSLEAGIKDHVDKWKSVYASAKTPAEAFRMLKVAGYATDPNYVSALSNVYRTGTGKPANQPPTDQPVATTAPSGGFDQKYDLGKGYGSKGVKIAGDLGKYIYKVLKTPQQFLAVTEHPDFGGISGKHASPGYKGYHKFGRAIDIGAYAEEQGPILKAIAQFNQTNNVKPVELFDAKHDPTGEHQNHVHVAYAKGGRVLKPTLATLAEDGRPEFVFDADTTKGLDSLAPNLLQYLNAAKTKSQLMGVLQSYAGYETGAEEVIEVVIPQSQMIPLPIPMPIGGGGFGGISGGSSDSSYDSLYAGS